MDDYKLNFNTGKYNVFIAYREKDAVGNDLTSFAWNLQLELQINGFNVFLDINVIDEDMFTDTILPEIDERNAFVLVLAKGTLDECSKSYDHLRREILEAVKSKSKIVLVSKDSEFNGMPKNLAPELSFLKKMDIVTVHSGRKMEESVAKLAKNQLEYSGETPNIPIYKNLEPVKAKNNSQFASKNTSSKVNVQPLSTPKNTRTHKSEQKFALLSSIAYSLQREKAISSTNRHNSVESSKYITLTDFEIQLMKSSNPPYYTNAMNYYLGLNGSAQDYSMAFTNFHQGAMVNDVRCQKMLGECLELGKGIDVDYEEAVTWYEIAANRDYPPAIYSLACCYMDGNGVEQNYDIAIQLLSQLEQYHFGEGLKGIADCYFRRKDFVQAAYYYEQAAKMGEPVAEYMLGELFYNGDGVKENMDKAYDWYMKAASKGIAEAMFMIGAMLYNGETPITFEIDELEAAKWFEKGAKLGCVEAKFMLFNFYYFGDGDNQEEGEKWFAQVVQDAPDAGYQDLRELYQWIYN